ncbi:CrcB family protein [Paenibacillus tarimensis]
MKTQFMNLTAIGAGASIGSIARYYLNLLTIHTGYPFGTLIENIAGSLILGFLTAWFLVFIPKEWLKLGLGVGLCGGFTTMSTLAADAAFLYQIHTSLDAVFYVAGTTVGGILAACIGYFLGTYIANQAKTKRKRKEVKPG